MYVRVYRRRGSHPSREGDPSSSTASFLSSFSSETRRGVDQDPRSMSSSVHGSQPQRRNGQHGERQNYDNNGAKTTAIRRGRGRPRGSSKAQSLGGTEVGGSAQGNWNLISSTPNVVEGRARGGEGTTRRHGVRDTADKASTEGTATPPPASASSRLSFCNCLSFYISLFSYSTLLHKRL